MTMLNDILLRTASKIGMEPSELQPYLDALIAIAAEELRRGNDVELMTLGYLRHESGDILFMPHSSLLPPGNGDRA